LKGKKVDMEFVSQFISQCTKKNIDTPELIVERAKKLISRIDQQIIAVEKQKVKRSKLVDVISTFEKSIKVKKTEEIKTLSFFDIKDIVIAKYLCDAIKSQACDIAKLKHNFSNLDVIFCIKQLLQHKVIAKTGNAIMPGEMFEQYLKFVFQEVR
jgi:hypothetical protein